MLNDLDLLDTKSLKGTLEALLLVAFDPVSATNLAKLLEKAPGDIQEALSSLQAEYKDANRGFQLVETSQGWRFYTHPAYFEVVESFILSQESKKLSQAALETLAVIAYHQPVTRDGVKAIRGVSSEGVISSLIEKGLVKEMGRDKDRGLAILYGTTATFLERFGLKSLRDLPDLEQFAPDEESKKFIRERLSGRFIESTFDIEPTDETSDAESVEDTDGPSSMVETLLHDFDSVEDDDILADVYDSIGLSDSNYDE